jgi:hypothetical protein
MAGPPALFLDFLNTFVQPKVKVATLPSLLALTRDASMAPGNVNS